MRPLCSVVAARSCYIRMLDNVLGCIRVLQHPQYRDQWAMLIPGKRRWQAQAHVQQCIIRANIQRFLPEQRIPPDRGHEARAQLSLNNILQDMLGAGKGAPPAGPGGRQGNRRAHVHHDCVVITLCCTGRDDLMRFMQCCKIGCTQQLVERGHAQARCQTLLVVDEGRLQQQP